MKEFLELNTSHDTADSKNEIIDLRLINHSLIGLIDKIIAMVDADPSKLRIDLVELRDAAIVQFKREEVAMRAVGYGAADQHDLEHKQLLSEIQRRIDDPEAGEGNASLFCLFAHGWLLRHIANRDALFIMSFVPNPSMVIQSSTRGDTPDASVSFDEIQLSLQEPIRWSAKHTIDIQPIDENHRLIFSLINEIVEARTSADNAVLADLLERLGEETAAHFTREEKVMADYDYEFSAVHQEEHRKLLDEYAHQVSEFRNGSISAELTCRFVYQWFVRHIEESDIPLGNAIHRQNSLRQS